MDEEPVEIWFDPHDREHLPPEVLASLASLPPDKIDDLLNGMHAGAIYRQGPATSEMDLVRFHDSNRPTTADSPTWHIPLEDAEEYALIASSREMAYDIGVKGAEGIAASDAARKYAAGPGYADVVEGAALPGRFGPRDAESHLHVPRGADVVTIESYAAKQAGGPDPKRGGYSPKTPASDHDDYRGRGNEYPGQGRQVLVVTYDKDKCTVTPRMKSVDLKNDAQARQAAALEKMRKSAQSDDAEGWDRAKAEYEEAAADEQKMRESTDGERRGYSMS